MLDNSITGQKVSTSAWRQRGQPEVLQGSGGVRRRGFCLSCHYPPSWHGRKPYTSKRRSIGSAASLAYTEGSTAHVVALGVCSHYTATILPVQAIHALSRSRSTYSRASFWLPHQALAAQTQQPHPTSPNQSVSLLVSLSSQTTMADSIALRPQLGYKGRQLAEA
jgi:hypothetical protein